MLTDLFLNLREFAINSKSIDTANELVPSETLNILRVAERDKLLLSFQEMLTFDDTLEFAVKAPKIGTKITQKGGRVITCDPAKTYPCGAVCRSQSKDCNNPIEGQAKTYAKFLELQGKKEGKIKVEDEKKADLKVVEVDKKPQEQTDTKNKIISADESLKDYATRLYGIDAAFRKPEEIEAITKNYENAVISRIEEGDSISPNLLRYGTLREYADKNGITEKLIDSVRRDVLETYKPSARDLKDAAIGANKENPKSVDSQIKSLEESLAFQTYKNWEGSDPAKTKKQWEADLRYLTKVKNLQTAKSEPTKKPQEQIDTKKPDLKVVDGGKGVEVKKDSFYSKKLGDLKAAKARGNSFLQADLRKHLMRLQDELGSDSYIFVQGKNSIGSKVTDSARQAAGKRIQEKLKHIAELKESFGKDIDTNDWTGSYYLLEKGNMDVNDYLKTRYPDRKRLPRFKQENTNFTEADRYNANFSEFTWTRENIEYFKNYKPCTKI